MIHLCILAIDQPLALLHIALDLLVLPCHHEVFGRWLQWWCRCYLTGSRSLIAILRSSITYLVWLCSNYYCVVALWEIWTFIGDHSFYFLASCLRRKNLMIVMTSRWRSRARVGAIEADLVTMSSWVPLESAIHSTRVFRVFETRSMHRKPYTKGSTGWSMYVVREEEEVQSDRVHVNTINRGSNLFGFPQRVCLV